MTQADNSRPTFSDEQLNLLYNACDVGITTTTGEGWGMSNHTTTLALLISLQRAFLLEIAKGWQGICQGMSWLPDDVDWTEDSPNPKQDYSPR